MCHAQSYQVGSPDAFRLIKVPKLWCVHFLNPSCNLLVFDVMQISLRATKSCNLFCNIPAKRVE